MSLVGTDTGQPLSLPPNLRHGAQPATDKT